MKKKPKMKSMALSILLTLAMVVGLMPGMSLTAFADGTPAYSGGTGTEADPYLISTVDDWKALADAVNDGEAYADKYFRQTADLNMSGVDGLVPVGTLAKPFAGNYEGDGFAISNATINGVTTDGNTVAGVFGVLTGKGSISNLVVENATVTATQGSGGWDMAFAGGLVAVVEDAAITDCSVSDSSVTAGGGSDTFSGAVVGYAQSNNGEVTTISQIASTNNTVVGGGYGGGVLGSFLNDGTLSMANCYAIRNNISAQNYSNALMGAFLGASQGGNISLANCFVYGCSVNATSSTYGKAGLFAGEGTVSATNAYYYDTNDLPVNADSATSKTAEEMKSLASTLGDAFTQGSDYPILLHPVNLEVSIEGWAYGEDANEPSVTRNSSGTPTYTYADKGATDFSATVPSNAGDYTVKATVAETATHKAAEATADFTIAKVDAAVTTAPTAKTLTANEKAQELVTAGKAEGGEMQYALGTDAAKAPQDGWSSSIPAKTDAGTYYVWYKVAGDKNHKDSEPACVTVKIAEKPAVSAAEPVLAANSIAKGKTAAKLSWNKVSGAAKYEIWMSKCGSKMKKVKTLSSAKTKWTNKKLKKKTTYKFCVVAKDAEGKVISRSLTGHFISGNVRGKYTNAKSLKLGASSAELKKGGTFRITAKQTKAKKGRKLLKHAALLRYVSDDTSVATVDAKGVVTAAGAGSCRIYVFTVNGISKTLTVTVK